MVGRRAPALTAVALLAITSAAWATPAHQPELRTANSLIRGTADSAPHILIGECSLTSEQPWAKLVLRLGLHDRASYHRARWYDPNAGAFLQADPLGMADGPNRYLYVRAQPTQRTDPNGLFSVGTHKEMTVLPLAVAGFAAHWALLAAEANAHVDDDQSGTATHFHAMRETWKNGARLGWPTWETPDQPAESNAVLHVWLAQYERHMRASALRAACNGDLPQAVRIFGTLLHTLQDEIAHRDPETGLQLTNGQHSGVNLPIIWVANIADLRDAVITGHGFINKQRAWEMTESIARGFLNQVYYRNGTSWTNLRVH
jgi:hypothetical protein